MDWAPLTREAANVLAVVLGQNFMRVDTDEPLDKLLVYPRSKIREAIQELHEKGYIQIVVHEGEEHNTASIHPLFKQDIIDGLSHKPN